MALFMLTCLDKAGALETRLATRPAHLDYVSGFGEAVKLAGPILSEADASPEGSFFILDMDNLSDVHAFADGDPYLAAGVFERRDVRAFRAVLVNF
jgi:uncharacterized protein